MPPYHPSHLVRRLTLCLLLAAAALVPTNSSAAGPIETILLQAARTDQLFLLDAKGTGAVSTLRGKVIKATLAEVVIDVDGKERAIPSDRVVRFVLADLPVAFEQGKQLLANGDFENAANSFKLAAADSAASPVAKVLAGAQALEAQILQAAKTGGDFAAVASDAARFISANADSLQLPAMRLLEARALWLNGEAGEAAKRLAAVFAEAKSASASPGYDLVECYRAGWNGLLAYVDAGDLAGARQMAKGLDSGLPSALAELAAEDPRRARLEGLAQLVSLGEGFVLLAEKKASLAKTFFKGAVEGAGPADLVLRTAGLVGLGQSQQAAGEVREARLSFARAFATGADLPEFLALALLGQAECTLKMAGTGAKEQARRWLTSLASQYGDCPAARRGAELAKGL
jgi:hypothetical protein